MEDERLGRALDFMCRVEERSYTSRTETPWGPAFFHNGFPLKYDLNYVRLEKKGDPNVVKACVDEVQGSAGLGHRKIQIAHASIGAALAPAFASYEWMVQRMVVMTRRPEPAAPTPVEVRELSFEELHPALLRWELKEAKHPAHVAQQLVESRTVTAQAVRTRYFAGLIDGAVAGWCELYVEERTAQVESVCTFTEFRGRGIARCVIRQALHAADVAGCDLSFLIADDEDWPKKLYQRLGFEEVGYIYDFTQPA